MTLSIKSAKFLLCLVIALGALALALILWRGIAKEDGPIQPVLGLSTSLPLYWGEGEIGDVMDRVAVPLPAYERLDEHYDIQLIDGFRLDKLKGVEQILLAQPRAFAPAEIAAIDEWVRGGGQLLLLADPALQWDSIYPLGDKRRPLFTSLLSPLLSHWGVNLVLPLDGEGQKMRDFDIKKYSFRTATPGAWEARKSGAKHCIIAANTILAKCNIGKGSAILIADADLLNARFWSGTGIRALFGSDDFDNIALIKALLQQQRAPENH